MWSMVTTVDNSALYNWTLQRVELKCSHQRKKKVDMWGDRYVKQLSDGSPFTMYAYIKLSCVYFKHFAIFFINYISIKLQKRQSKKIKENVS